MRQLSAVIAAGAIVIGCRSGAPASPRAGWRERPGQAELRVTHYSDNSGLTVDTAALAAEQPVSSRVDVRAHVLADRIVVEREQLDVEHERPNQPTGHREADVVTSASSTVAGGEVSRKLRFEGVAGATARGSAGDLPATIDASFRGSTEEDYGSLSGVVGGTIEAFERNLTAHAFVGYGRDTVTPVEAPPGQDTLWPASHHRWVFGVSVSQLLSPAVIASGSFGYTLQEGMLANPYRRALVRTSLFPEVVPNERGRLTAFAGISWSPVVGTGVHVREGFYADSWGVIATIPEVAVSQVIARRLLLSARYRFYRQLAADFYEPVYPDLASIMTGDMRLGRIHEHVASLDGTFTFLGDPGGFGSLAAALGYELSMLEYEQLETETITAGVLSAGLIVSY